MNTSTLDNKILIGGQALRNLGSDRFTEDIDFLVNDTSTIETFICTDKVDYINANGNKFFSEIYNIEKGNEQATPQSLFELKVYAFVQHCQNFNWAKVDASEYDIKFLVREFNTINAPIAKKYISQGEWSEIAKVIKSAIR